LACQTTLQNAPLEFSGVFHTYEGETMNSIIIHSGDDIGNVDAEYDDKYLFDCFIYNLSFNECNDVKSPKSFLYGRTGSGKTAILRQLEHKNNITKIIDLTEISLDYVSNSTVVQFLTDIDVDLDLFFQTMWKHVLCLEYIKLRFTVNSEQKSKNFFSSIYNKFKRDATKAQALNYLEKYADRFWIDTDRIVKELTESFEKEIQIHGEVELDKFSTDAGYIRKLSEEKKIQLKTRFKKFVNHKTLTELNKVMMLLKAYEPSTDNMPIFILIDKIDEEWVETEIKYRLIRSLIEAQKSFGKISDLKIVVTIRADIFERVIQETMKPGMQREKFEGQLSQIKWNSRDLKKLVDQRVRLLCNHHYTNADVGFDDIFTNNVGQKNPFEYILDRTHYRPRDVISFVNTCLQIAEGKTEVAKKDIIEAEKDYSRVRLEALKNEWVSALPSIYEMLDVITKRRYNFKVNEILSADGIDDFILNIYAKSTTYRYDPVFQYIELNWTNLTPEIKKNLKKIITAELYKVGAVSIKLRSGDRHYHSYKDAPIISYPQINDDSKVNIHPAFHIALNVHK